MHHTLLGKIAVFALIALSIAVAGGGIAVAGEVRQKAKLTIENGAIADVELELRTNGDRELSVKARVEGLDPAPESSEGDEFALCVDGLFIEDEEVDDKGRVDIGGQIDPGAGFTLLPEDPQDPKVIVEIVNIGTDQDTCDGDVVLSGEVTSLE